MEIKSTIKMSCRLWDNHDGSDEVTTKINYGMTMTLLQCPDECFVRNCDGEDDRYNRREGGGQSSHHVLVSFLLGIVMAIVRERHPGGKCKDTAFI